MVINVIVVAFQVHSAQFEVAGIIGSTSGPDGVIAFHPIGCNIINLQVLGFQVQFANVAAQGSINEGVSFGSFSSPGVSGLVSHFAPSSAQVSLAHLYVGVDGILTSIIDVAIAIVTAETASSDVYHTQVTGQVSALEIGVIIAGFILTIESLVVFQHGNVMPVVVYFASEEQTGTQFSSVAFSVFNITSGVNVAQTNVTGNLYHVCVLFQFSYANAQVVQFVSEFANQSVISADSALSQSLGYDLRHFITGHGAFTFEGAIRIAVHNTSSSQFGNCAVSPVACGNIGERVGCESSSAYAQSHSHCKN